MKPRILAALLVAICAASTCQALLWIVPSRFAAGGGGGSTTLNDFSGLVAWYKTPISGASGGSAISSWPDSKASYNLTSTSGTTYNDSAVNGLPSVSINGSGYVDTGGSDSSTYPYTFVAVVKLTNTSDYRTILGSSSFQGIAWTVDQTTGYMSLSSQATSGIGTSTSAIPTGSWHIVMAVATSTNWQFWIDGASAGSGSHSITLTAGRTFRIAQYGGSYSWLGEIAEIGIYGADRSSDATAIYNALKTKYGL